jgi:hypothetical protein
MLAYCYNTTPPTPLNVGMSYFCHYALSSIRKYYSRLKHSIPSPLCQHKTLHSYVSAEHNTLVPTQHHSHHVISSLIHMETLAAPQYSITRIATN